MNIHHEHSPSSVHESTGYSPFRLMMGEECSLPQDVSTAELRTQRENDVAPHPFATWVRDALEVAYDHVRSSLKKTASRRKRLYDTKAVNRKFPVGSWVLRYYPPAAQHKLGSCRKLESFSITTGGRSMINQHSPDTGTVHYPMMSAWCCLFLHVRITTPYRVGRFRLCTAYNHRRQHAL